MVGARVGTRGPNIKISSDKELTEFGNMWEDDRGGGGVDCTSYVEICLLFQ